MDGMATKTAFVYLWTGTFLFAVANGTLEAVANPLVATLFPNNRTHYLNILHASWPAGLVIGGFIHSALATQSWKVQLGCFMIPAVFYGILFLGQHFPKSEASQKGLKLGEMLREVGILGAAIVGFFVFLFFKDGLGPLLSGFTGSEIFGYTQNVPGASSTWLYLSAAGGGLVFLMFGGASRWTIGAPLLFVLFAVHALGRRSRTGHGRLDSEHRRRDPRARRWDEAFYLHLGADVRVAILRELHRAQTRPQPRGHPARVLRPRVRGTQPREWCDKFHWRAAGTDGLRRGKDLLLAHDARGGI
jgi:hypothetical protein